MATKTNDKAVVKYDQEDLDKILNSDEGMEGINVGMRHPNRLKILQDLQRQAKYFADFDDLAAKHAGMLFIDDGNNLFQLKDLMKEYKGTLLKIERGHLVYGTKPDGNIDPDQYIGRFSGNIRATHRELWKMVNPDMFYVNQIRVITTNLKAQDAIDEMRADTNPFQVYTIKGSGNWNAWFGIEGKMQTAMASYPAFEGQKIVLNKTVEPTFILKTTTEKVKNDKGEFYVPVFDIEINEPSEVLRFIEISMLFKNYRYYSDDYGAMGLTNPLHQEIKTEAVEAEVIPSQKEEVEEDDLPF